MRLTVALLALVLLGAVPAFASGAAKKAETEPVAQGPRIPSVSMPTLVAPVNINGELQRYADDHFDTEERLSERYCQTISDERQ